MKKVLLLLSIICAVIFAACGGKKSSETVSYDMEYTTEDCDEALDPIEPSTTSVSSFAADDRDDDWDDDDDSYSSSKSSENWDKILDEYEKYVDSYIKLAKKANSGDMNAMTEYLSTLENAQRLGEKLEDADDAMTTKQIARYERIMLKLSKAVASM